MPFYFLLSALWVAVDQVVKYLVRTYIPLYASVPFLPGMDPVSYTHLDVYKRQPTTRSASSGPWRGGRPPARPAPSTTGRAASAHPATKRWPSRCV